MVKGFAAQRLNLETDQWIDMEEVATEEEMQEAVVAAMEAAVEAMAHSRSSSASEDMKERLGVFMAEHAEMILGMLEQS